LGSLRACEGVCRDTKVLVLASKVPESPCAAMQTYCGVNPHDGGWEALRRAVRARFGHIGDMFQRQ